MNNYVTVIKHKLFFSILFHFFSYILSIKRPLLCQKKYRYGKKCKFSEFIDKVCNI